MQVAYFNLSRAFEEEMAPSSGNFNSPQWCCPERLSGKPYSLRLADVFRSVLNIVQLLMQANFEARPPLFNALGTP